MGKFVVKFFIIFFSFIYLMFFSLIYFNDKAGSHVTPPAEMLIGMAPPSPQPPPPPVYIPLVVIMILSFVFIFFVLIYINKTFVEPLVQIENNVKKIKDGSLDVEFKTKSDNKEIKGTYATLNEMTIGLKQKKN